MTNVGVKGVSALFDTAVSAKANVQSDNHTESFDETLNGMRTEKSDDAGEYDGVRAKKVDDNRTASFETTGRKNSVKPEEEITDEQIAAVSEEVISQIKEMIMEKYNLSEEQLEVTMNSLGLTDENLLNATDLTQIIMKLEGVASQADMLTNPDFAKNLKEILSRAEEIKENVSIEDVEFKDMMSVDDEMKDTDATSEVTNTVVEEDMNDVSETVDISEDTVDDEVNNVDSENEIDGSEEAKLAEQLTAEKSATESNENSDGLLKHNDDKTATVDAKTVDDNAVVQPQDFAQKLTEDLSAKVGETKANDIVRQVIEQTQIHVKQGVTSLEMQLYPEHLGKVLIQVVSHDGNITAQITAESEAAKNALESQLTLLKDNLNNQGIKVENVEVTIASHAFEQNMQGERNSEQGSAQSKKGRRSTDMFFDEIGDETAEEADKEIMELKGSTVSYTA